MSLELAIQANTAAIQQLIAVMSAGKFMSADGLKEGPEVVETFKKITPAPLNAEETKTVVSLAHIVAQVEAEEPKEAAPVTEPVLEPAKPLAYEADVLPVLHKFLVAKGKPAAESLLKKYGVDKFSKVPAAQLGDLLADIRKEMGVA